jgi:hypothetical protein
MFDQLAKELEAGSPSKTDKDFYITQKEFEDFCKAFLFEELKDKHLGKTFLEKYGQSNYVLSILSNKTAKEHIKKFYIK